MARRSVAPDVDPTVVRHAFVTELRATTLEVPPMSTLLTRVRTRKAAARALLFGGVLMVAGACSPHDAIALTFYGDKDAATRVAHCESTMNPGAVSPTNDHGLFQINIVHRAEFERVTGQPWSKVYDARWNTVYARHLHASQGWRPWSCQP